MSDDRVELFNRKLLDFVDDLNHMSTDVQYDTSVYDLKDASVYSHFNTHAVEWCDEIVNQNASFFSDDKMRIPRVNVAEKWRNASTKDKMMIWKHVQLLSVISASQNQNEANEATTKLVNTLKTLVNDSDPSKDEPSIDEPESELKSDLISESLSNPDIRDDIQSQVLNMFNSLDTDKLTKMLSQTEHSSSGDPSLFEAMDEEFKCDTSEGITADPLNAIKNTKIGKLAEEISRDLDLGDFMNDLSSDVSTLNQSTDQEPSISDQFELFQKVLASNPDKLSNIIQNIGSKVQLKMSNGEIDEQLMMSEIDSVLSNFGHNKQKPMTRARNNRNKKKKHRG